MLLVPDAVELQKRHFTMYVFMIILPNTKCIHLFSNMNIQGIFSNIYNVTFKVFQGQRSWYQIKGHTQVNIYEKLILLCLATTVSKILELFVVIIFYNSHLVKTRSLSLTMAEM